MNGSTECRMRGAIINYLPPFNSYNEKSWKSACQVSGKATATMLLQSATTGFKSGTSQLPICYGSRGVHRLSFWDLGHPRYIGVGKESKLRYGCVQCNVHDNPISEGATSSGGTTLDDSHYMRRCVSLAKRALGCTTPNPMVGCVIVKDSQIVGEGFHPKAGEAHAEVFALREAGTLAKEATAYVSLEPCNHYGRTPPCTQALIQAGVKRVVVGMVDPNPIVAGKGVATLRESGIDVTVGVEEKLCRALNEAYIHRMLTGKPFVAMRFSISLDGGMLDSIGHGAAEEGGYYSELLQQYDGVIVSNHALYDNPTFVSCESGAKQPLRIVVTKTLDLSLDSHVFDTRTAPTLVLTDERAIVDNMQSTRNKSGQSTELLLRQKGVDVVTLNCLDIDSILDICSQRDLCSVLLDSRMENFIAKQALEEEEVHKLVIAICPIISGQQRVGVNFDIPPVKVNGLMTAKSKEVVIVEGYFQRD